MTNDRDALPAPIALTPEQLGQVAAGSGMLLGSTVNMLHIAGGIRVPTQVLTGNIALPGQLSA